MSRALREARFHDGCSLDAAGLRLARSAASSVAALPVADRVWVSDTVRCRETADALGLEAVVVPALAGLGVGCWRGSTLAEVGAKEPQAVALWLADPESAPHGGETVREFCERISDWLDSAAQMNGRALAVVEPEVVRAVVVRALGTPAAAFWRIDVPPLTATEFSGRSGRWNLRMGQPLGQSAADTGQSPEMP